jgi:CRP-like cAMP-binding protein
VDCGSKSLVDKQVVGLPEGLSPRFFAGLTTTELDSILSVATLRHFPQPAVIIHQDDPADRMFLLTRGQGRQFVLTNDGRKIILYWLTAGQFSGGVTMLSAPCAYLASTEVLADSCALVWDRKTLREFVSRFPILLDNALSIAATEHFAWSISARVSLSSDDAVGRIAHLLVSLACGVGKPGPDGVEIQVANEDLAAGANVTPFTVSRTLGEWQRNGILTKGRGKLLLRRPELLIDSR